MIDLKQLAQTRAQSLSQDVDAWVNSAWSPDFQRLSQALSDGEVEMFFTACHSVEDFRMMTSLMIETTLSHGISFGEILNKVARTGFLLTDWFQAMIAAKKWADKEFVAVTFFEILVFVNACALKATREERQLLEEIREGLEQKKLGTP